MRRGFNGRVLFNIFLVLITVSLIGVGVYGLVRKPDDNGPTGPDASYLTEYYRESLTGDFKHITSEDVSLTKKVGDIVTANQKTYTGFSFDSTNANNVLTGEVKEDNSLVLKVYYTRNSYNLELQTSLGVSSVSGQGSYKYEESANISATLSQGYDFDAWQVISGNNTNADLEVNSQSINIGAGDLTLKAIAKAQVYNITYKDMGDATFSGEFSSTYPTTHTFGTETVLVEPTKDDFVFAGFYTDSACSGERVTSLSATAYLAGITLFAKWDAADYVITYKANGGLGNDVTQDVTFNGEFNTKDSSVFTREGYTLSGWSTSSTSQEGSFANLNTSYTYNVSGDTTLYAVWTANEISFEDQTLDNATYNSAYISNRFNGATNGTGSYTYTIISGAPNGISINSENQTFTGTLTSDVNTYKIVVRATDNETGKTADATFTLNIVNVALSGNVNISGESVYGQTLTATVTGGESGETYVYQWQYATAQAGPYTNISGATNSTLALTSTATGLDVVAGKYFRVKITGESNYTGSLTSDPTNAVDVKELTWETKPTIENKTYDASITATISAHGSISGVVSGDVCTLEPTNAAATFSDANVGNKEVTVIGYALTGTHSGNYSLAQPTGLTANILLKTLTGTVSISGTTTYGQTLTANVSNEISGETYTYQWQYATAQAGPYTNISGATNSTLALTSTATGLDILVGKYFKVIVSISNSNYTGSLTSNASNAVAVKELTWETKPTVDNKIYDGSLAATISAHGSISGVVSGDACTLVSTNATATFSDANVGDSKAVTVIGYALTGTHSDNYSLSQPTGIVANIEKAEGSISFAQSHISTNYGNSVAMPTLTKTGDGVVTYSSNNLDAVMVDASTGNLTIVAVGSAKITATVTDTTNYTYATKTAEYTVEVSAKEITVSGLSATNRFLNGTTQVTLTGSPVFSGLVDGDDVTISIVGTSASSGAGEHNVTVTLTGADAGNYTLVQPEIKVVLSRPAITFNVSANGGSFDTGASTVLYAEFGTKNLYTTATGSTLASGNTLPKTVAPDAYHIFLGYYDAQNGTTQKMNDSYVLVNNFTGIDNETWYAKWQETAVPTYTYTINFKGANVTNTTALNVKMTTLTNAEVETKVVNNLSTVIFTKNEGENYKLVITPSTSYNYYIAEEVYNSYDSDLAQNKKNINWTGNANRSVDIYVTEIFTISFNKNGGTGSDIQSVNKVYGESIAISENNFTKSGFTPNGWNTLANGTGDNFSTSIGANVNDNLTLYANFDAISYMITYDANGGKFSDGESTKSVSYTQLDNITTLDSPIKANSVFDKWVVSNSTTASWTNGEEFDESYTIGSGLTGNVTLTARWKAMTKITLYDSTTLNAYPDYTITNTQGNFAYNVENYIVAKGHDRAVAKISFTLPYEQDVTIWAQCYDGTNNAAELYFGEIDVENDTSYEFIYGMDTEPTNVLEFTYPNLSEGEHFFYITYTGDDDGEDSYAKIKITSIQNFYVGDTNVTIPTPEKDGYTFGGWFDNDECEGDAYTSINANSGVTSLYAKWHGKYSVTWKNYDGSTLQVEEYNYGETPSYNGETPARESTNYCSYTFNGWTPNITTVSEDITYTATFTENPISYTITYNTDGGSSVGSQNYTYATDVEIANAPTKSGYTFISWEVVSVDADSYWTVGDNYSSAKYIGQGVYGNVTLKAIWQVENTINFSIYAYLNDTTSSAEEIQFDGAFIQEGIVCNGDTLATNINDSTKWEKGGRPNSDGLILNYTFNCLELELSVQNVKWTAWSNDSELEDVKWFIVENNGSEVEYTLGNNYSSNKANIKLIIRFYKKSNEGFVKVTTQIYDTYNERLVSNAIGNGAVIAQSILVAGDVTNGQVYSSNIAASSTLETVQVNGSIHTITIANTISNGIKTSGWYYRNIQYSLNGDSWVTYTTGNISVKSEDEIIIRINCEPATIINVYQYGLYAAQSYDYEFNVPYSQNFFTLSVYNAHPYFTLGQYADYTSNYFRVLYSSTDFPSSFVKNGNKLTSDGMGSTLEDVYDSNIFELPSATSASRQESYNISFMIYQKIIINYTNEDKNVNLSKTVYVLEGIGIGVYAYEQNNGNITTQDIMGVIEYDVVNSSKPSEIVNYGDGNSVAESGQVVYNSYYFSDVSCNQNLGVCSLGELVSYTDYSYYAKLGPVVASSKDTVLTLKMGIPVTFTQDIMGTVTLSLKQDTTYYVLLVLETDNEFERYNISVAETRGELIESNSYNTSYKGTIKSISSNLTFTEMYYEKYEIYYYELVLTDSNSASVEFGAWTAQ